MTEILYPRLRSVEAYILHHTQTRPEAAIESIRAGHKAKGWVDIGYHWVIRQGVATPGRPETAAGAHAHSAKAGKGWNARSIGIALVGDYRAILPVEAQLVAVVDLLAELATRHGKHRILGHRQAMAEVGDPQHTDCPGCPWPETVRQRLGWGWGPEGPATLPDEAYKDPA